MKNLFSIFIIFILTFTILMTACDNSGDEPTPSTITASDFSTSIDENPTNGDIIGTVEASATEGTLTYTLSNQSITGALAMDTNTGELSIADASAFDFETNTSITANYTASNGTEEATGNITITINDIVSELNIGENGLIAHYTFDNTLSDAMDNFPDMVVEGGTGLLDPAAERDRKGEISKSYRLRSDGKYIKLNNQDLLVDNDKSFTITVWVYPEGDRQITEPIIYKEFDYELQVSPGEFINPVRYNSRVQYGIPSDTDTWGTNVFTPSLPAAPRRQRWSHIALVCDSDEVRVYVNGIEVDAQDITAPTFKNSDQDLYIGAILDASGNPSSRYTGRVDDFRYYNQALTETQIQALANDL